jgi:hypothetical protein
LTIIVHKITPSFLAVALNAAILHLRYCTLLKKFDKWVSFKFPIALAEFLNAIFNLLLPLGTLLLYILPPLICDDDALLVPLDYDCLCRYLQ